MFNGSNACTPPMPSVETDEIQGGDPWMEIPPRTGSNTRGNPGATIRRGRPIHLSGQAWGPQAVLTSNTPLSQNRSKSWVPRNRARPIGVSWSIPRANRRAHRQSAESIPNPVWIFVHDVHFGRSYSSPPEPGGAFFLPLPSTRRRALRPVPGEPRSTGFGSAAHPPGSLATPRKQCPVRM